MSETHLKTINKLKFKILGTIVLILLSCNVTQIAHFSKEKVRLRIQN